MNPVEQTVRKLDAIQQKYKPLGFVVGVVKKYGDDNGGVLAGNLTHSAFMSLFPLLLVLTTVLGLIAAADKAIRTRVISALEHQIPLITDALKNVHQLQRNSTIGLIVGSAALLWGATGLAQAGLHTMAQVWNLPGPDRPGFFPRLGRSVMFLGFLGLAVIGTTLLTGLSAYRSSAAIWLVLPEMAAAVVNIGLYFGAFRILTPKHVPTRQLLPGAIVAGVLYTAVQFFATYLAAHYLKTGSVYGVFATVLGLLAWIYLVVQITVYSAEINVVLARRLWPRAIVQPPLTEADRIVLGFQALQNQRRPEEHVEVTFTDQKDPDA